MKTKDIINIVSKVYPKIAKDYKCDAKVELYKNIFDRLNSTPAILEYESYAEYSWNNNKIYLYTDNLDNEEDIIRSLIHECVHANQDKAKFDAYYLCGETYDTHPYEIEAKDAEENWKEYKIEK